MPSTKVAVEIEEVQKMTPRKFIKPSVDPLVGRALPGLTCIQTGLKGDQI